MLGWLYLIQALLFSGLVGLASKLEISNNVYFEGYQTNVINHLASCHLLLPSIQELAIKLLKSLLSIPSFGYSGVGILMTTLRNIRKLFDG